VFIFTNAFGLGEGEKKNTILYVDKMLIIVFFALHLRIIFIVLILFLFASFLFSAVRSFSFPFLGFCFSSSCCACELFHFSKKEEDFEEFCYSRGRCLNFFKRWVGGTEKLVF
jgi:hypothetical protein